MGASKRDQLVEAALRLFDRDGYHATGIEAILREAGVAKMTLYNHFRSKDELMLAALRLRDERHRNWLMREVETSTADPRERLLAVFDAAQKWYCQEKFNGCAFARAAGEFADPDHPVRVAAREHSRMVHSWLTSLASSAGAVDPPGLAAEMCLLLSGATTAAQVSCCDKSAEVAKGAASRLIETQLGAAAAGA